MNYNEAFESREALEESVFVSQILRGWTILV